jgi:hypothetical protein
LRICVFKVPSSLGSLRSPEVGELVSKQLMLGRVVGLQQLVGGGQLAQASLTQAVGPRQQLYKENR